MTSKSDSGFQIVRFSDVRYEKITVEIQFNGEAIMQINQDLGINKLEVELLSDFVQIEFCPKCSLTDFLTVIDEARTILVRQHPQSESMDRL